MDLIAYSLIANLITYLVLFIGFPALLTRLILAGYRRFRAAESLEHFRWVTFLLVSLAPLGWLLAGYSAFKQQCSAQLTHTLLAKPAGQPDGFLIDQFGVRSFADQQTLRISRLIEQGQFAYYEEATWPTAGTQYRRVYAQDRSEIVAQAMSSYVVEMPRPEKTSPWSPLPIYVSDILIKDRASGHLLSKAQEIVFGGGIASVYLRAIGRDQDEQFLACGYLSKEIGAWRPTLTSNPRYKAYAEADARFVQQTLTP